MYSRKKNNTYVGCTKNLLNRLREHKNGLVESTKNRRPITLIYEEKYSNLSLARRREKYLKSLYGYRERRKIIKNYLEKK